MWTEPSEPPKKLTPPGEGWLLAPEGLCSISLLIWLRGAHKISRHCRLWNQANCTVNPWDYTWLKLLKHCDTMRVGQTRLMGLASTFRVGWHTQGESPLASVPPLCHGTLCKCLNSTTPTPSLATARPVRDQ